MCGGASIWAKIAFPVVIIALILDIIGFATISWMVYQITTNYIKVGLWQMMSCAGTTCATGDVAVSLKTGEFKATQALEILAFILFLCLPFVVGAYVFIGSLRGGWFLITVTAMCFTASFLAFIGMIIWMASVPDPYVASWSMGLTVLAAILAFIAGLLLVFDMLGDGPRRSKPSRGHRITSPSNSRFDRRF